MTLKAITDIFKEVLDVEETMSKMYEDIISKTQNEEIKKKIKGILKDELRHVGNAKQILFILK